MKKLIGMTLLLFVAIYVHGVNFCQFEGTHDQIISEGFPEGSYFSMEVDDTKVFDKMTWVKDENGMLVEKWVYPVFYGVSDYMPWDTLSWINIWPASLPYYGIENPIDIEKQETGITFKVRGIGGSTTHNTTCFRARTDSKPVKFPANCLQKIYFLNTLRYSDCADHGNMWFSLYLHNNETKDLVCNIKISIVHELIFNNYITMELSNCNKKYEVTHPGVLIGGSCKLHIKPRSSDMICRDFYTSDFLMMFGNCDNPFDKWDIRPVGKVGESTLAVDEQRTALICNVYASSESGFLPLKTYYNAEELLAHFKNGWDFPYTWFHTFYTPVDSISIKNATYNFDRGEDGPRGSILPGNSFSINTMYSWDRCKHTHFKADSDQCNYKWVHLFAYKYMPEIPPSLAYDIVYKNTGVVEGHLVLHLRMVDGKDGKRWWLDSVEGDFFGQKAEVKGGPGFLGIDNKPWCISFR